MKHGHAPLQCYSAKLEVLKSDSASGCPATLKTASLPLDILLLRVRCIPSSVYSECKIDLMDYMVSVLN